MGQNNSNLMKLSILRNYILLLFDTESYAGFASLSLLAPSHVANWQSPSSGLLDRRVTGLLIQE